MAEEDKSSGGDALPPKTEEVVVGKMPPATPVSIPTASQASAAAALLAWPPLLLHPWGPALLPGAWCSSAIRSALPGLVVFFIYFLVCAQ